MTIEQAAAYLQLSRETLYKYAQSSRVPAVKVGRHWRFSRNALGAWAHDSTESRPPASATGADRGRLEILVVDDEASLRRLLGAWVDQLGHNVRIASNGHEAIALLGSHRFDVLFLDLHLDDMLGTAILSALPEANRPAVVLITGAPESTTMDEALRYPIAYALSKPFQKSDVAGVIDMVRVARMRNQVACPKPIPPRDGHPGRAQASRNTKEVAL